MKPRMKPVWPVHLGLLVVGVLGLSPGARADILPPLSLEQSTSLARSIRLWTWGMVSEIGGFTVTPADGHYELSIPLPHGPGPFGFGVQGGPITAQATPGDDGRWHLDAITLPSPLQIRRDQQVVVTETMQDQQGSATIDPTLAARSTGETTRSGISLRGEGLKSGPTVSIAKSTTHEEWVPSSPGRVDIASATQAEDVMVHGEPASPDAPSDQSDDADADTAKNPLAGAELAIHHLTTTFQGRDADPDRAALLMPQLIAFAASLPADKSELTPPQRAALHGLLAQSRDLARGGMQSVNAEGIAVSLSGHDVTLDTLAFSTTTTLPDSKLDTKLRLEVAGLGLGLPPGAIHDLVPHRLVIASSVIGQSLDNVYAMADGAIDDHAPQALAEDAKRHLAEAPVNASLDELAFDLGPAALTARGHLMTQAAGDMDGGAVIEVTGFDALMKLALGDALLSQAVPVLIFLKGVGEQTGDKLVWNIAYKGAKLTINGTDLSGLMPHK